MCLLEFEVEGIGDCEVIFVMGDFIIIFVVDFEEVEWFEFFLDGWLVLSFVFYEVWKLDIMWFIDGVYELWIVVVGIFLIVSWSYLIYWLSIRNCDDVVIIELEFMIFWEVSFCEGVICGVFCLFGVKCLLIIYNLEVFFVVEGEIIDFLIFVCKLGWGLICL